MPGYYDYLLIGVPVAMFGGPVLFLPVGIPYTAGIAFGALVAAGIIGHGLFIRSPVKRTALQNVDTTKADNQTIGCDDSVSAESGSVLDDTAGKPPSNGF